MNDFLIALLALVLIFGIYMLISWRFTMKCIKCKRKLEEKNAFYVSVETDQTAMHQEVWCKECYIEAEDD